MGNIAEKLNEWQKSDLKVFWGEIAACDHVVQIYESDAVFLSSLKDFIYGGFQANDSVIVIGTQKHLDDLYLCLKKKQPDLDRLIAEDLYIPLNAEMMLAKFMRNNWPDETLFHTCINEVIERAGKNSRKIRAFGEMVAILWSEGKNGATVQLENLWNQLHSKKQFTLYCAYPKSGFTQSPSDSINNICCTHSKMVHGGLSSATEIYYKKV